MNRFDKLLGLKGEAKVHYLDGEYQIVEAGEYVRCAVTGQRIPLPDLRYWSVARQEPYATAQISLARYLETRRAAKD